MKFSRLRSRRIVGAAPPAVAGAVLFFQAHAGRPLATDTAAIVANGACPLEPRLERGCGKRALWANPGCNPFVHTERDRRVHAGLPPPRGDTESNDIATWPLAGEVDFAFGAQTGLWSATRQANVGLVFVTPVLRCARRIA